MRNALLLSLTSVILIAHTVSAEPESDGFLLKTHWYQDGPFAKFTPGQDRVGCWSTAYAQILYYHRLKPHGRVRYECASGYQVDVDLDQYRFNWEQFPKEITSNTPATNIDQAALYSFATAAIVRKDFGTERYKRLLNSAEDLESHFDVDAEIYVNLGKNLPISPEELSAKLKAEKISNLVDQTQVSALLSREIAARRPVFFHFGNIKDFGHSTVIDGIRKEGKDYWVHLNYGAVEAERNKWYLLFAPIAQADDETLRAFVTIQPRHR